MLKLLRVMKLIWVFRMVMVMVKLILRDLTQQGQTITLMTISVLLNIIP